MGELILKHPKKMIMNKFTTYFFTLTVILLTISCSEENESVLPDTPEESSILFLVNNTDTTRMTQKAGETATFTAVIDYGTQNPDKLVLLSGGRIVEQHALSSTPPTVKLSYLIPVDTTAAEIMLTAELREETQVLATRNLTLAVAAGEQSDEEEELPSSVDTTSFTLQVAGMESAQNDADGRGDRYIYRAAKLR